MGRVLLDEHRRPPHRRACPFRVLVAAVTAPPSGACGTQISGLITRTKIAGRFHVEHFHLLVANLPALFSAARAEPFHDAGIARGQIARNHRCAQESRTTSHRPKLSRPSPMCRRVPLYSRVSIPLRNMEQNSRPSRIGFQAHPARSPVDSQFITRTRGYRIGTNPVRTLVRPAFPKARPQQRPSDESPAVTQLAGLSLPK